MKRHREKRHGLQAMLLSVVLVGGLVAPAAAVEDDLTPIELDDELEGELEDELEGELEDDAEVDPAAGCEFTAEVTGAEHVKYRFEREVDTSTTEVRYKKQGWSWNWGTTSKKRTEANVGNERYGTWNYVRIHGQWQYSPWLDEGVTSWDRYTAEQLFRIGSGWYRYTFYESRTVDGPTETESRWSHRPWIDSSWGEPVETKVLERNRVRVFIDGERVVDEVFGGSWTEDYTLEHGQTFEVKVKAHGAKRWKTVQEGVASCPPQPDELVDVSEWEDGEWACDDTYVTRTRTITTTPYVWDVEALEWVEDTDNAAVEVETEERELTEDEFTACPDEPEVAVTTTEWEEGEWDCDDTHVTRTRSVTTTPWIFDEVTETWVEDTDNATTEQEAVLRELTDEELAEACTEVLGTVDEVDEEPEFLEVTVAIDEDTEVLGTSLPRTGASVLTLLVAGLLALFAGTSALRRREGR